MRTVALFSICLWASSALANDLDTRDAVADASASDVTGERLRTIRVSAPQPPTAPLMDTPSGSEWRHDSSGCDMRFRGPSEVIAVPTRTLDAQGQVRCLWYVHHTESDDLSLHFQALRPAANAFQTIVVQHGDGRRVGPGWTTPMASATAVQLPRTVIVSVTPSNGRTGAGLDIVAY